jgi:hypothetical protein
MEIPYGSILTSIGTVIGVVVANWLTYHRSNREKVWDLRRQAYGVILSELAAAERICDSADEYIQENVFRYFESEVGRTHDNEILKDLTVARQRVSDDYLILSEAFIALYAQFDIEKSGDPYNGNPPENHDRFAQALRKNRKLLLAQARSEMNETNKGLRRIQRIFSRT